jgi:hypothetical protein
MSFDKRDTRELSQFNAGVTGAASTPGKRTQVDALSAHGWATDAGSYGALGAADAAVAAPKHVDHGNDLEGDDEAGAPDSSQPGEIFCQTIGEADDGGAAEADADAESQLVEDATPGASGANEGAHIGPAGGATVPGAPGGSAVGASTAAKLEIKHQTVKHAAKGADTRTTVGVGEAVQLAGSVEGSWSANHGTISAARGAHATWTAPATAGSTTIRFSAGGKSVSKTFRVIAPTGLTMKKASEDAFPAGQQGVGMITNVTVGPTSVSFGNVQWLEVPGPASGITGYFTRYPGLAHKPNPNWLQWNDQNTGLTDHASLFRWPKPWAVGGFQWAIPNKWRVASAGGAGHVFTTTHQVFRMTNQRGTTTITKGGASVTRTP